MILKYVLFGLTCLALSESGITQTRIETAGSPDFSIANAGALSANSVSRLFFKNGSYFSGGIGTTGASASTARLSLFTQASTDRNLLQERLTILNNGYVGIGTINPQYLFQVKTGPGNGIGITQESSDGQAKIGFWTNATSAYIQTHNNVPLNFATNNLSAQMTLTTAGRLGIGTTVPASKLEVKGKAIISQQVGDDVALEVSGPIKVSGANPAAFVATAGAQSLSIEINHPATNNNPNAIILVTPRYDGTIPVLQGATKVYYNSTSQRWNIEPAGLKVEAQYLNVSVKHCDNTCATYDKLTNAAYLTFEQGMQFNVLVISR